MKSRISAAHVSQAVEALVRNSRPIEDVVGDRHENESEPGCHEGGVSVELAEMAVEATMRNSGRRVDVVMDRHEPGCSVRFVRRRTACRPAVNRALMALYGESLN